MPHLSYWETGYTKDIRKVILGRGEERRIRHKKLKVECGAKLERPNQASPEQLLGCPNGNEDEERTEVGMAVEPMTVGLNALEVSCTEYRASPHIKDGQMTDGLKDDTMTPGSF